MGNPFIHWYLHIGLGLIHLNTIKPKKIKYKYLRLAIAPFLCVMFLLGFCIQTVGAQETPTPTPTPDTTISDLLTASNGILILLIIWIIFLGLSFSVKENKEIISGFTGIIQIVFGLSLMSINDIIGILITFFSIYLFYMALSGKSGTGKKK